MTRIESRARLGWMVATVVCAIVTATLGTILAGPSSAAGQSEADDGELRAYWQGRYRKLRETEATLVQTVKLATKEYADSNRRSYRRSGVRHFHRTNANEAKAELKVVRAQIAAIYDDANAAGVPIFWLDEVAEELIGSDADREADDDGRNPLYTGNDDEPASLEGDGSKKGDYEAWRANRAEYERERAPEKHLDPGWDEPTEED